MVQVLGPAAGWRKATGYDRATDQTVVTADGRASRRQASIGTVARSAREPCLTSQQVRLCRGRPPHARCTRPRQRTGQGPGRRQPPTACQARIRIRGTCRGVCSPIAAMPIKRISFPEVPA